MASIKIISEEEATGKIRGVSETHRAHNDSAGPNCRRRWGDSIRTLGLGTIVVLLVGVTLACAPSRDGGQTLRETPVITQPSPAATAKPATNSDADKKSILDIVSNYYAKYDSCMRNPPPQAQGRVGEYCQNNSGLTTTAFPGNLQKGGTAKAGADPVTCSQNPPGAIVATDIQISDNRAAASVRENFGPTEINIQVELLRENSVWKVDNITCPKP